MLNTSTSRQTRDNSAAAPRSAATAKKTFRARARNGFTLIEILAVVAIIAILAGILAPVISTVLNRAKKSVCEGRFDQWITGILQYKQTYSYYPPLSTSARTEEDTHYDLSIEEITKNFVRCLSGKNIDSSDLTPAEIKDYNPRIRNFCNFDQEAFRNKDPKTEKLVDYKDNDKIHLVFDTNDDQHLVLSFGELPDTEEKLGLQEGKKLKASVMIYTLGKEGSSGEDENVYRFK